MTAHDFVRQSQSGTNAGETACVIGVPDGGTLLLDTGLKVRLVGIQAPRLAMGRPGMTSWPLAEAARQGLTDLVLQKRIRLDYAERRRDRHGRALARVVRDDGTAIQQALLEAGHARVYSFADTRRGTGELLRAEARARQDNKGIWAHPFYAVRTAQPAAALASDIGRFTLIEGMLIQIRRGRHGLRLDFTRSGDGLAATIPAAAEPLFGGSNDLTRLERSLVRLRGTLRDEDGPHLYLTHPEQIEVVAGP